MTVAREINLRPVEPADEAFPLDLYAGTRADELAPTPWNAAQRRMFGEMQFAVRWVSTSRAVEALDVLLNA